MDNLRGPGSHSDCTPQFFKMKVSKMIVENFEKNNTLERTGNDEEEREKGLDISWRIAAPAFYRTEENTHSSHNFWCVSLALKEQIQWNRWPLFSARSTGGRYKYRKTFVEVTSTETEHTNNENNMK